MIQLRPYQNEAVNALLDSYRQGVYGGLVVLPTAAGKSLVLAELCRRLPAKRILVLAHRQELVQQNAGEYFKLTGETPGVWSASLGAWRKERVTFAQIQSAYKQTWPVDLVLIDESHLLSRNESSMYHQILDNCNGALLYGLTATPYRLDSGHLLQGEDALFTSIVYEAHYNDLHEQGFLAGLTYKNPTCAVDNDEFNLRGGEINQDAVELELVRTDKLSKIVADVQEKTTTRSKCLWFCPTVEIAKQVTDRVQGTLITADTQNRADVIAGDWKHLINIETLTTGFNYPAIDCIVFIRPTKSTALFKQMLGRGTRNSPGKESCLVLDYTTNTLCHGFLGDEYYTNSKKKRNDKKKCPACNTVMELGINPCDACGYKWLAPSGERKPLAGVGVTAFDPEKEQNIVDVKDWTVEKYFSMNSQKESLKVTFKCAGIGKVCKWFVPYGFYTRRFLQQVGGKMGTLSELVTQSASWKMPSRIIVTRNDKGYFNMVDVG